MSGDDAVRGLREAGEAMRVVHELGQAEFKKFYDVMVTEWAAAAPDMAERFRQIDLTMPRHFNLEGE